MKFWFCVPFVLSTLATGQDPQKKLPPKLDLTIMNAFFGGEPTAPKSDNAPTAEKVALGKLLYHEPTLSKAGNQSCATCHDLEKHGQDGKATPAGGTRNTPTSMNAFRQIAQSWDGRAATIEDQVMMSLLSAAEHGLADEAELVGKIKAKPELVAAFDKAFAGQATVVSAANTKQALGAFLRTLTTKSAFDEFLAGKSSALTSQQKWGLKTFIDVGCTACHMTRLLGGHMYQKMGVQRAFPTKDEGRFLVTKAEADKFLFKVPTLLNVAQTGPWLHDGSIATLAECVKVMGQVQLNRELTPDEIASIVSFLETLTGKVAAEPAAR